MFRGELKALLLPRLQIRCSDVETPWCPSSASSPDASWLLSSFIHTPNLHFSCSPVQLRRVVPSHVLSHRRPHLFPDPRGAPSGSVRGWHSHEQHQVPLQQQPDTGGARHELGRLRQLERGLFWWRNLWHWDQDGGLPVGPWWLHTQWCALPLLFQVSTGRREGCILEDPEQSEKWMFALDGFILVYWVSETLKPKFTS